MSEPKRVPLQTLEFPESLGHATKKEKKGEKGKQLAPSFRFTLALPESNEKACPEFNYAQLLKAAEKKRRKEQKRGDENSANGLDPFDDDDDDDKLREMAKRFEAKYGTATAGRKRHNKIDDYVDLGAGYDENDSFIDNTDAYDEIVPEEMTTVLGGFYINCGALEYKTAEGQPLVHNNNNNNNNNIHDEDESSESSEDDAEAAESPKRTEKRILSSTEEDETEDIITVDHPRKKQKLDENVDKKSNHEGIVKKKKKQNLEQSQQQPQQQQQLDLDALNRRKNAIAQNLSKEKPDASEGGGADDPDQERKRAEKSELQRTKCITDKKPDIMKKLEKKTLVNGIDGKKLDLKKLGGKDSNIDDAIESVVNAGRVEDESSRETSDSGKSRGIAGTESECDDGDKEESILPESLPEDLKDIVYKLKLHANNKEGKTKFFNSTVNAYLFRLKTAIDSVMPSVVERHNKDCQRIAEEKGIEGSLSDAESTDAEENPNKNSEKLKIPRKRFPWTEETKKLVYEISKARRQYFEVVRPRKETIEPFVANFMESEVFPLWPPGWVRLQTLLSYSNSEPNVKRKAKKPAPTGSSVVSSSANAGVPNCTGRIDAPPSTNNMNPGQERVITPTSFSKTVTASTTASNSLSENPLNFTVAAQSTKTHDINTERKQQPSKYKDKNRESPMMSSSQYENSIVTTTGGTSLSSLAKISAVPTSQLMPHKTNKSHLDKFNLMDLTGSSLSITPVNETQITQKNSKPNDLRKDVVSITAYSDCNLGNASNAVSISETVHSQSGHVSVSRQQPQDTVSYLTTQMQQQPSSVSSHSKSFPLKHRFLQESIEVAKSSEKIRSDEKDSEVSKSERREKRRDRDRDRDRDRGRGGDGKHSGKSHDAKKRKKEQRLDSGVNEVQQTLIPSTSATTGSGDALGCSVAQTQAQSQKQQQQQQPHSQPAASLSTKEQEQRQIDETVAATSFLSRIINDEPQSSRVISEPPRKEAPSLAEEPAGGNVIQPTEQENDVQMVMRSLKELEEMQNSPNHSPGGGMQKPSKSNVQYIGYQEDYLRLYHKKEDKLRIPKKEEPHW
ncbi:yemanuclein isoform X2 [Cephus cinctus]|uniref:Yemanuclein isoform X2 n=1 Tax=Cephus cinctus TaxID=211228 RepID=A0AAJ7C757_CEPCN|nr:yemanuclein isoform X2 [Cephus cinctus]